MLLEDNNIVSRCLRRGGMVMLLALAMLGFAPRGHATIEPNGMAGPLPVPPGMARIWIYREYEPYDSLARPYVRLNGAIAGISEPGGAFYRDVPPGNYAVTVDSLGTDVNQFVTVSAAPGQQVFVKVLVSGSWDSGGGGGGSGESSGGTGWEHPTFYTWQIVPQAAAAEIAHLPLYNGS
jgi:hypothetical protein